MHLLGSRMVVNCGVIHSETGLERENGENGSSSLNLQSACLLLT